MKPTATRRFVAHAFHLLHRPISTPTRNARHANHILHSVAPTARFHSSSLLSRRPLLNHSGLPQRQQLRSTSLRNTTPSRLLRHKLENRRPYSSQTPPPPPPPSPPVSPSLSARFKKLSREYGYSALGVYFALSALDFPFCFLAVRALGADRIGEWEEVVLQVCWRGIEAVYPGARDQWRAWRSQGGETEQSEGIIVTSDGSLGLELATDNQDGHSMQNGKHETASIGTQLALAYAIHKSFIFIRVPLTAAVTPKVVKVLRSWGWNIGKRKK